MFRKDSYYIFKKGNKTNLENYRPIAIVPTFAKIFESLLNDDIINYFESNQLFSPAQFGFRKKRSTVDAIISLLRHCFDGLENKKNC